jgi:hypothetical protein
VRTYVLRNSTWKSFIHKSFREVLVLGDKTRNTPALTRIIINFLTKRRDLRYGFLGQEDDFLSRIEGASAMSESSPTLDPLNIFQPANHPINSRGVPELFSALEIGSKPTQVLFTVVTPT